MCLCINGGLIVFLGQNSTVSIYRYHRFVIFFLISGLLQREAKTVYKVC